MSLSCCSLPLATQCVAPWWLLSAAYHRSSSVSVEFTQRRFTQQSPGPGFTLLEDWTREVTVGHASHLSN